MICFKKTVYFSIAASNIDSASFRRICAGKVPKSFPVFSQKVKVICEFWWGRPPPLRPPMVRADLSGSGSSRYLRSANIKFWRDRRGRNILRLRKVWQFIRIGNLTFIPSEYHFIEAKIHRIFPESYCSCHRRIS